MAATAGNLTFDESLVVRGIYAKHVPTKLTSTDQLRGILGELGQYPNQQELDTVLDAFDSTLDFEDVERYLGFLKRAFIRPEPKDADTVRTFVALGGRPDRSGHINASVLKKACMQFNLTIDIDHMIAEVDDDGSGEIEYDEFRMMWERSQQQQQQNAAGNGGASSTPQGPSTSSVAFQVEPEETQTEDEYLNHLRAFLRTDPREANSAQAFNRTGSMRRKQSRGNGMQGSTRRQSVLANSVAASPDKSAAADDDEVDEEEPAAKPEPRVPTIDPTYRKYMMTDPIVVGGRNKAATPRRPAGAAATLPPITPRGGQRRTTSRSPRRGGSKK